MDEGETIKHKIKQDLCDFIFSVRYYDKLLADRQNISVYEHRKKTMECVENCYCKISREIFCHLSNKVNSLYLEDKIAEMIEGELK